MNIRLWLMPIVFLAIFGCKSEAETSTASAVTEAQLTPLVQPGEQQLIQVVESFSSAIKDKNREQFLAVADSQPMNLVRLFTSGNLGGRGEPLSRSIQAELITDELEFPIEKQTPFSLAIMFPSLPIDSAKSLPFIPMSINAKALPLDQWAPSLKVALAKLPNIKDGALVVLADSANSYWVLADAQIIDNVLVGGFAVFNSDGDRVKLVGLIDLL